MFLMALLSGTKRNQFQVQAIVIGDNDVSTEAYPEYLEMEDPF